MNKVRRLLEVDVFGERPLLGNPLAVVLDADGLSGEDMQAFARWTNLSETTFLLPATVPEADYRLRIFTPRQELPFAGHPSIGSAFAARWSGIVDPARERMVQECAAGLLPLRVEKRAGVERVFVRAPQAALKPLQPRYASLVSAALGLRADTPVLHVDVGARWLVAPAQTARSVLAVKPDYPTLARLSKRLGAVGATIYGWQRPGTGDALEVRSFVPADGNEEDPVCGSGNAAVAAVLNLRGDLASLGYQYSARQGRACKRDGRVQVQVDPRTSAVEIGGVAWCVVEGSARF